VDPHLTKWESIDHLDPVAPWPLFTHKCTNPNCRTLAYAVAFVRRQARDVTLMEL